MPARHLFQGDWLDTGDLGYLAAGHLYVTGRVKDLIIRAGRNLHPDELERIVGVLPGVRRGCVAVFAAPDPAAATERLIVVAETGETDSDTLDGIRRRVVSARVETMRARSTASSWPLPCPGRSGFVAGEVLRGQVLAGLVLRRIGTVFVERWDREQGVADATRLADLT